MMVVLLIVPFGLMVWLVHVVWVSVVMPCGYAREPSCGSCHLPVRDCPDLTCKACGADLRRVGIITRAMTARRRGGLARGLVSWLVLWLIVGVVATPTLQFELRSTLGRVMSTTQTTVSTLTSASGTFLPSTLTATSMYDDSGLLFQTSTSFDLIGPAGARVTLSVNGSSQFRFSFTDENGRQVTASSFQQPEAMALMQAAGIDIESPSAPGVAFELSEAVNRLARPFGAMWPATPGPDVTVVTGAPTTAIVQTPSPNALSSWLAILVALVLWCGIALWVSTLIWRRRRWLQREYAAPLPP